MELGPGYKQTEVGVIPEEWEVTSLGTCLLSRPDYGINAAAVRYSDRLPAYIRITDITADGRFSPTKLVSVDSKDSGHYYLEDGDIVFARTGASVGKSYRYDAQDGRLVFAGFLIRVRPDPTKLLTRFLAAYVTTGHYWNWARLMSMRSGQPGINGNEYAQLPIPRPPLPEQRVISDVLGEADDLLRTMDRLIAKKRDLKQAATHQLLAGHRRLPGFTGAWTVRRVGEIADVDPDTLPGNTDPSYTFRYIALEDVDAGVLRGNSEQVFRTAPSRARRKLQQYDVLVGTVRPGLQSHLLFTNPEPDWVCSTGFAVVRCKEGVCTPAFLFSQLFAGGVTRQIDALLAGSNYPAISSRDVRGLELLCPPEAEQAAIAGVLSDMDAELKALEVRRDKTRDLKQAMMHELLTGRIRLL